MNLTKLEFKKIFTPLTVIAVVVMLLLNLYMTFDYRAAYLLTALDPDSKSKPIETLKSEYAEKRGNQARFVQSNHEGALIDVIQQAGEDGTDGIVLNPGAYTHYSYAIHDALRAIKTPAVEVHISDIASREPWRQVSVTAPACVGVIAGQGFAGYLRAMDLLEEKHQEARHV